MWTWSRTRARERKVEADRLAALYVNPFLFAAEDLQSRLYNILADDGLSTSRARQPGGEYAQETVYLLARYLCFEQALLRFTRFGSDAHVVAKTRNLRRSLASDGAGSDPWCVFWTKQLGLAQFVQDWTKDWPDTIPFLEFDKRLTSDRNDERLHLTEAVSELRAAEHVRALNPVTQGRLRRLQADLVDVLEYVEKALGDERGQPFTGVLTADAPVTRKRCQVDVDSGQSNATLRPRSTRT